jgi:5-methylcytosine-specific restriction protein A
MIPFKLGETYTRERISKILTTKDASIRNGVFRPSGRDFVLLFVTENKTRDRTPYNDALNDDILFWDGQNSGRTDRLIIDHTTLGLQLLLMYRSARKARPDYSFVYLGRLAYIKHEGAKPAHFQLKLTDAIDLHDPLDDAEKMSGPEGREYIHLARRYERNKMLRELAISLKGYTCSICGFNFSRKYGTIGENFAEVHHIIPLSEVRGDRSTDPRKDLVIVCSNCHSMLHRKRPALLPEYLKKLIES